LIWRKVSKLLNKDLHSIHPALRIFTLFFNKQYKKHCLSRLFVLGQIKLYDQFIQKYSKKWRIRGGYYVLNVNNNRKAESVGEKKRALKNGRL